jgi:hypothetical protein
MRRMSVAVLAALAIFTLPAAQARSWAAEWETVESVTLSAGQGAF